MSLGSVISKYRKELGITQESLAQQLEVTNQAVSKWEGDQCCPDVMLLPRLADIFGITIDALFEREAPAKPEMVDGLPWEDDGNLRGVLFRGHELIGHGVGPKLKLLFQKKVDANVYSDFSVVCGDVVGEVHAGGDVQCDGVTGNVDAGGDVSCGTVLDSVEAGGDVQCTSIGCDVNAGGDVKCEGIGGNIEAGGDVKCGAVAGYVEAGGDVACMEVQSYVEAGGDVACQDVLAGYVSAGGDVHCISVSGPIDAGGDVIVKNG